MIDKLKSVFYTIQRNTLDKIRNIIVDIVCDYVVVGARCGCCGVWVDDDLVPFYWRITICRTCIEDGQTKPEPEVAK